MVAHPCRRKRVALVGVGHGGVTQFAIGLGAHMTFLDSLVMPQHAAASLVEHGNRAEISRPEGSPSARIAGVPTGPQTGNRCRFTEARCVAAPLNTCSLLPAAAEAPTGAVPPCPEQAAMPTVARPATAAG